MSFSKPDGTSLAEESGNQIFRNLQTTKEKKTNLDMSSEELLESRRHRNGVVSGPPTLVVYKNSTADTKK